MSLVSLAFLSHVGGVIEGDSLRDLERPLTCLPLHLFLHLFSPSLPLAVFFSPLRAKLIAEARKKVDRLTQQLAQSSLV